MMDVQNHLRLRYISLAAVEIKTEGNFCGRFRNNAYRGCKPYNQNFRGRYRSNFNSRGNFGYNAEVVRDIGIITIITEGTITEVKVMIGIEADH